MTISLIFFYWWTGQHVGVMKFLDWRFTALSFQLLSCVVLGCFAGYHQMISTLFCWNRDYGVRCHATTGVMLSGRKCSIIVEDMY